MTALNFRTLVPKLNLNPVIAIPRRTETYRLYLAFNELMEKRRAGISAID